MDIESIFSVSVSALNAEKLRMNVVASNLANANSTRTPEGGPYRRKDVVFASAPVSNFKDTLISAEEELKGVAVEQIVEDSKPFKQIYNPGHPDADDEGYVMLPNVNVVEEMVNMMAASRAYEANITALQNTKAMIEKSLELGTV